MRPPNEADELAKELTGTDATPDEATSNEGDGWQSMEADGAPDIWPDQVRYTSREDEEDEESEARYTARPADHGGLELLRS